MDREAMELSLLFEKITRAKVIDCFQDKELICFVVAKGELGKALGKGAINLKRVQQEFGKRVKLIEHSDDVIQYARNAIYPLQVEEIAIEDQTLIIRDSNKKTKSLLIGRDGKNLQLLKRAIRRFFNVDVKVV